MSSSAGSSSSSNGQLGARPKTGREPVNRPNNKQPTTSHHQSNKEWNSNWNSILSTQAHGNSNGQPPSSSAQASFHRPSTTATGWMTGAASISRGVSDPSLAIAQQQRPFQQQLQQQPVYNNNNYSQREKSSELFHSHHYHARRQRERPTAGGSRSSSAADLSRSSTTLSSNSSSLNNVQESSSGRSSIWSRWFRRNNSRPPSSDGSPSFENSPVLGGRRAGSSGALSQDDGDTLSTNSFAFVRQHQRNNQIDSVSLRRKYGLQLCAPESSDSIEGDAIRAMRTRWESQMRQMEIRSDQVMTNGQNKRQSGGATATRKKRPAPPPPLQRPSPPPPAPPIRLSSAGFTHVPGKRRAPSPPVSSSSTLNIPARPVSLVVIESPSTEKWTNDLNSNLDDRTMKAARYHQSKINSSSESTKSSCPSNDILKLEGGLLRPVDGQKISASTKCIATAETPSSTIDSSQQQQQRMMTLPLRPWYKRHHSHHSHNHPPPRSKWKDAALLHPPVSDDVWIGLPITPVSPQSTLSSVVTVSPGGSTRSGGSSSDGSRTTQKKRKSLLVNISQLDREAGEIIQRERARESQRKKMEDEKFYSAATTAVAVTTRTELEPVADVVEESSESPSETKCARELINMFNSLSESINSPAQQPVDANNKTMEATAAAAVETPADDSKATITRLRVNRETVVQSTANEATISASSVFNPKLEAVASSSPHSLEKRTIPPEYAGARPKEPVASSSQWTCHVCTLLNSDARLWCEACTALKPRRPLSSSKPAVWDQWIKKALSTSSQSSSSSSSSTKQKEKPIRNPSPPQIKETETVEIRPAAVPSSPEALRQARLAFFLNGQKEPPKEGDTNNNNKRHSQCNGVIKVSSSCQTNLMTPVQQKARPLSSLDQSSQASTTESLVSSSSQNNNRIRVPVKAVNPTQFPSILSPSRTQLSQYLQQQQAVKKEMSSDGPSNPSDQGGSSTSTEVASDEKKVEGLLWRLEEAIAAGQFDKAAVLAKELAAIKRPPASVKPVEPAALSVAAQSSASSSTSSGIVLKPVAAPRSIIPASIKPAAVEPPPTLPRTLSTNNAAVPKLPKVPSIEKISPQPAVKRLSVSEPSPAPRTILPIEATKQPEIVQQKTTDESVNVEKEEKKQMLEPVTNGPVEVVVVPAKLPEPTVPQLRTKRKTKVSSGQQTTLSFNQIKSSSGSDGPVQPQRPKSSCLIIDDTFNVEVFIEDRSTHSGPFPLAVRPATTLLQLKEQMEKERQIPVQFQRWILGRRLADQDDVTLQDYDICPSNSHLFLYILTEPVRPARVIPVPVDPVPPSVPLETQQTTDNNARRYYNYEEDRYSTCDESDDDVVVQPFKEEAKENPVAEMPQQPQDESQRPTEAAGESLADQTKDKNDEIQMESPIVKTGGDGPDGWTCPGCTLVNPTARPGCEACAYRKTDNSEVPLEPPGPASIDYKKLIDLDGSDVVTNADEFDCPVCLMSVPSRVGVTLRECLHNFCRDCLAHVIEFNDEAAVTCPYRDNNYACDAALQEREIKALVGPKVYEKHLERSMRLAEKAMKNTFHCQTADCPGWAVIEEDNVNVFRCPVCRRTNCLTCQAIHDGANCKEFQDRVNDAAETDEDAKRTKEMIDALVASGEALSCPQCQVVLMKRMGCDWVRCSVCRTEICWVTKQARWGPKGKGDTTGGCRCGVNGIKCHALCNYCH